MGVITIVANVLHHDKIKEIQQIYCTNKFYWQMQIEVHY